MCTDLDLHADSRGAQSVLPTQQGDSDVGVLRHAVVVVGVPLVQIVDVVELQIVKACRILDSVDAPYKLALSISDPGPVPDYQH